MARILHTDYRQARRGGSNVIFRWRHLLLPSTLGRRKKRSPTDLEGKCEGPIYDRQRKRAWQKERMNVVRASWAVRGKKEGWRLETPLKFGPKRQTISECSLPFSVCVEDITLPSWWTYCICHRIFNYDLGVFIISKSIVRLLENITGLIIRLH